MCAGKPVLDTKDRRVCFECVEEEFLRAEIEEDGHDGTCFYCKRDGKAFSIDQMADLVDTALSEFFYRTATEPTDHAQGLRVADVISRSAGIGEAAAEDIRRVLSERQHAEIEPGQTDFEEGQGPFDHDARYARNEAVNARNFERDWSLFEESLKRETRYFNRTAEAILTSIFGGIDGHKTINGRPIVVEAGPGKELAVLYRARVFQAEAKLQEAMGRPGRDVGPPPPSVAVAGRMNAAGIAVFYGATDPSVALAEVRPPVGSKVLIASFEVIRPLRLLDLSALELVADEKGSIFDRSYIRRLKRAEFLRELSQRISRPVMPDNQPGDYLPTQVIADFLATAANPPLDGIIYPSDQVGHLQSPRRIRGGGVDKRNVVLFQKAAHVQALDIPDDAVISISDGSSPLLGDPPATSALWLAGNGIALPPSAPLMAENNEREVKYAVFEEVASATPSPELDDVPLKFLNPLIVHYVRGVTLDTVSSPVLRYRVDKREPGSHADTENGERAL